MTDPRLARYAQLICEHSLGIDESHRLLIGTPREGSPLAVATAREAWRRGARVSVGHGARVGARATSCATAATTRSPTSIPPSSRASSASIAGCSCGPASTRPSAPASPSERDAALRAGAGAVDGPPRRARGRGRAALGRRRLSRRRSARRPRAWAPARGSASSTRRLLLDEPDPIAAWRALGERHARLIERLAGVRELRVTAAGTDLRVDVDGRAWESCAGEANLPDGEVFCAPAAGRRSRARSRSACRRCTTAASAATCACASRRASSSTPRRRSARTRCSSRLDTDEGARRVGEFAIGTNEMIQRAVGDTLFDEKIGGTCHLALGRSFPLLGGDNVSAIHWDLVCDLRSGGRIDADGEPLLVDGRLLV